MAIDFGRIGAGIATGGVSEGVNLATGGALFNKKKVKPIDITGQLQQVKDKATTGRRRTDELFGQLQPLTEQYQTGTEQTIAGARDRGTAEREGLMAEQSDLAEQSKAALRANLYSKEFGALPDALRAVREASAAGSGVDSGAYQQSVQNIGRDVSRSIVEGETGLQAQGLQSMQDASKLAYSTFSNLSSKLDDQELDMIAKVMDTKRGDLVQRTAQQLGLDTEETQAIIDLMNFQQSGQFASSSAEAQAQRDSLNALISGGSQIAGAYAGKK